MSRSSAEEFGKKKCRSGPINREVFDIEPEPLDRKKMTPIHKIKNA